MGRSAWTTTHIVAVLSVIALQVCERMAFFLTYLSLQVYLVGMVNMSQTAAHWVVSSWVFAAFIAGLVAAWLADSQFDRFKTITWAGVVYTAGLIVGAYATSPFAYTSFPYVQGKAAMLFLTLSLAMTAAGSGALQSTILTFFMDQVGSAAHFARAARWFFLCIMGGVVLGSALSAPLHSQGEPKFYIDPDGVVDRLQVSFWRNFVLAASVMVLSLAVVMCLKSWRLGYYTIVPPTHGTILSVLQICRMAIANRWRMPIQPYNDSHWLYHALPDVPRQAIQQIKPMINAIHTFAFAAVFYMIFFYTQQVLIEQGRDMSWSSRREPSLPIAPLAYISLVPVIDFALVSLRKKYNIIAGPILRISVGIGVSAVGCACATFLEQLSLRLGLGITVWMQLGAYIPLAVGEILTVASWFEFAYLMAPESMKTIVVSLLTLALGTGHCIGILLPTTTQWILIAFSLGLAVMPFAFFLSYRRLDVVVLGLEQERGEFRAKELFDDDDVVVLTHNYGDNGI